MAAIQTTLTLRDDISKRLKTIEKRVRSLAKTMDNFNKGFVKAGKSSEAVAKKINKLSASVKKLGSASSGINTLNKNLERTGNYARSARSDVDSLTGSVRRLATAYLSLVGIGKILDTADAITGVENKLGTVHRMTNPNATDAETQAVIQGQMDDIFRSAQRSRSSYTDAAHNVGKLLINAEEAFGGNMNKALAFNELMAKSYTIGGASDKEQSSSMYQLIQALGSGNLAGDELRSVREGAQVAYKYIEDHAQLVLKSTKSLKDLASEGLITSTIVTDAILKNAEAINSMFEDTQVTFEQTWTMFKNDFVKAFEPVLQRLTKLLNDKDFQEMMTGMTNAFVGFANATLDALEWIASAWKKVNDWVRKNADVISNVLIPIVVGLVVAWLAYLAVAVVTFFITNWWLLLIIGAVILLISAIMECAWVGELLGAVIGGVLAYIWNLIVILVNGIYDIVVMVYNFIANIVNTFANMFTNGFDGFLIGVAKLFWSFVDLVIDGLQVIARLFDSVFGTNISASLGNFQKKVNDFISKNDGIEEKIIMEPMAEKTLLNSVDKQEWMNKGAQIGRGAHDWLNNTKDKLASGIGGGAGANALGGLGGDWSSVIGGALDNSGTGENIGDIADNIELAREDLEFLRELAEMEAINKFTTAEIKVEMNNQNNINGENDLDGLVTKLSEKIEEEMHIVAEGDY